MPTIAQTTAKFIPLDRFLTAFPHQYEPFNGLCIPNLWTVRAATEARDDPGRVALRAPSADTTALAVAIKYGPKPRAADPAIAAATPDAHDADLEDIPF
jgi:hypothetical protein